MIYLKTPRTLDALWTVEDFEPIRTKIESLSTSEFPKLNELIEGTRVTDIDALISEIECALEILGDCDELQRIAAYSLESDSWVEMECKQN